MNLPATLARAACPWSASQGLGSHFTPSAYNVFSSVGSAGGAGMNGPPQWDYPSIW